MAGGAGGREVGRISIRVVPDLDEFRAKVEAATKGITDPKVHVEADTAEAREEIDSVARDRTATVHVKTDESGIDRMRRSMDELNTAFERRMKNSLQQKDLIPDAHKEMERRLSTMDLGWDKKLADLKRAPLTELEEKFKLKPALDEASIEEMRMRLSHENFTAKVKLETDKANLERMIRHVEHGGFDGKLDKIFGAGAGGGGGGGFFNRFIGQFNPFQGRGGGGISPGGGMNLGSVANFGSAANLMVVLPLLAPALAMISQVAVSIPALIGGIAAPLGVFALGIGGIKKALDDVDILKLDQKFGKDGKPKGDAKQKLGDVIKHIQEPIEKIFEDGFKPIFASVATAMANAPVFTQGLQFIAKGIVNFASGIAEALTSGPNLEMLDRFSNSVGTMLNNLTPGMTSFGNAMIRLTTDVGDHLPGLGNWVTGLADRFSNWITKIDQPGPDGQPSELDSAVTNMKPILNSVVDLFGNLMDQGLKMAADPGMAKGIKDFFDSLNSISTDMLPGLAEGFKSMASGLKDIADVFDKVNNWHPTGVMKSLLDAMGIDTNPKPSRDPNKAPGTPGGPLGPPSPNWHPNPDAPGANGNRWDMDHSNLGHPWYRLGHPRNGWFGKDEPGDNPGSDLIDHPLGKFPSWWANAFGGESKKLEQHPLGMLPGIWDSIKKHDGLDQLRDLFGMGTPKAGADTTPFNPGPRAPQPAQAPAQPAVGTGLAQGGAQGAQQAQQAAQAAQQAAAGVQQAFAGLPGQLQGIWQQIAEGAKTAFQGLVQGAQQAVQQILAEVQKLPGEITAALSGLRAAGESAGRSLGEGLAAGIAAGKGAAVAAAADLAAAVTAAGKTTFDSHSPSRVWHGMGTDLTAGLGEGMDAGSGDAVDRAQALAGQINEAMQGGVQLNPKDVQQQIKQALAELDVQRDQLQAQRDAIAPGPSGKDGKGARDAVKGQKAGISEQLRRVKQAHDALTLERDETKLDGKGGGKGTDSMTESAQMITKALASILDGAKSAVMANVGSLEHDLGISGNGAIPKIAEFGLGWAQSELTNMINADFGQGSKHAKDPTKGGDTHFHVNSMGEALQADRTLQAQKALQWKGR